MRMVPTKPTPTGPLGPSAQAVHQCFTAWNLGGEVYSEQLPLVAFNILADVDMSAIKSLLDRGEADGWWHYETGCVTDRWQDA
jgi:uncharacterized protein DUF4265